MSDSILERAFAKRDAALHEAREWDTFIRRYRDLAEGSDEPTPKGESEAAQALSSPRRPEERPLPPDSELAKTIAIVESILIERGRPVPLPELYEEITKRGFKVSGKKPRDNLGARLYNSGRFRSLSKATGWWFKDRPVPEAAEPPKAGDPESEPPTPQSAPPSGMLFGPKLNGSAHVSH